MILIHQRLIYVHLPKCAGTTVVNALAPGYPQVYTGPTAVVKHLTVRHFQERVPWAFENFRLLATVRHPARRLVSYYRMVQMKLEGQWHFDGLIRQQPFEDWVRGLPEALRRFRDQPFPYDMTYNELSMAVPMVESLRDNTGTIPARIRILRQERLAEDWPAIAREWDLPALGASGNVDPKAPRTSDYFTPELIDIVAEVFREDFETFGYDPADL